jgi:2-polyprenyl-6-hydroxyphenyl methylase/3-demethylubiquinone-9 3-methyltransferase
MTLPSSPPSPPAANSVDPHEIAFYERLAGQWWDPAGPFWPLHRLNAVRVGYLCDALARHFGLPDEASAPLCGHRILDIGCGGGILSEPLARLGAEVHGVDVVEKNIRIASLHADEQGLRIRYESSTAERLAANNACYDAVMNLEVVEHVADLETFLSACCTLVRPGGIMAIASLNRTRLAFLAAIVLGEYVLGWLPRGTHRWSKFPTPAELQRILVRNDLQVLDRIGVRINPLTRAFALSHFQAINFMLTATKPLAEFDAPAGLSAMTEKNS